jgi:tetratricopeptide (TPR) repeat protein
MRSIRAKNPQAALRVLEPWQQKYPSNLELANDYAIVLAQLGRLEDASKVLETAFLSNPQSQEAFENLRQILSRQAAVFYAKAVGRPAPTGPLALKGDPLAVEQSITAADSAGRIEPNVSAQPSVTRVQQGEQKPLANVTEASRSSTKSAGSTVDGKSLRQAVTTAAERWAQAWESKDFEGYLAAYSRNFQPQKFPSREAWVEHRRPRVTRPGPLLVRLSDIRVKPLSPDRAEVTFRQRYEAAGTKLTSTKTMVFEIENGDWKILLEDGR